jgi:hypothetical protein
MTQTAYNADLLIHDVRNLHHLLETTREAVNNLDFGPHESRDPDLDRVAALVAIASDMASAISERADRDYDAIASMPHPKLDDTALRRVVEINEWTAEEFRRGERSSEDIVAEAAQRLKALS